MNSNIIYINDLLNTDGIIDQNLIINKLHNNYLTEIHTLLYSKTPVTPEWRPYSVPTAFTKIAERRCARCANASNAVETLCNRLQRHAAAFTLSMLNSLYLCALKSNYMYHG